MLTIAPATPTTPAELPGTRRPLRRYRLAASLAGLMAAGCGLTSASEVEPVTAPIPAQQGVVSELDETERLVRTGQLPAATLERSSEDIVTRSLIDRGLLPEGSTR